MGNFADGDLECTVTVIPPAPARAAAKGEGCRTPRGRGVRTRPNIRPDAMNIGANGRVNMIEVASASQNVADLEAKLFNIMGQLPTEMQGTYSVVSSGLPSLYPTGGVAGGLSAYQTLSSAYGWESSDEK
jgi:hypothetical protein